MKQNALPASPYNWSENWTVVDQTVPCMFIIIIVIYYKKSVYLVCYRCGTVVIEVYIFCTEE